MRVFSYFKRVKAASPPPVNGAEALAKELAAAAEAGAHKGYFRYLLAAFRGTSPYALWQRARTVFAPAIFLSRAFRVLRWILRILEASALFLFAGALLLLAIPFVLVLTLAFIAAAALSARRADRRLAPLIRARRVLVVFSPLDGEKGRPLSALAAEYTVLAVTPLFSSPDTGTGRFSLFEVAKLREDGVILVREYYYFRLAKTLLREAAFCARVY